MKSSGITAGILAMLALLIISSAIPVKGYIPQKERGAQLLWNYFSENVSLLPMGEDYNNDGIGDFIIAENFNDSCRLVKLSGISGDVLETSQNVSGANATYFIKDFDSDSHDDVLIATELSNTINLTVISGFDLSILYHTEFSVPFTINSHSIYDLTSSIVVFCQGSADAGQNRYNIYLTMISLTYNLQFIWSNNLSAQLYYYKHQYGYQVCSDENSDGINDIFVLEPSSSGFTYTTTLYLISGTNGSEMYISTAQNLYATYVIQDIDNDSKDEFVVSTVGYDFVSNQFTFKLYAYEDNLISITTEDINGMPFFPIYTNISMLFGQYASSGGLFTPPMKIIDINNDGRCDVEFVEYSFSQDSPITQFRALDLYAGADIWNVTVKNYSIPLLYPKDIDGNGVRDFILAREYNNASDVYAISDSGNLMWNISYNSYVPTGGLFMLPMGYADVNGDNFPDICLDKLANETSSDGGIMVISALDGSKIWSNTTALPSDNYTSSSTFIGDVNGDNVQDIAVVYSSSNNDISYILIYSGKDGELLWLHRTNTAYGVIGTYLISEVTGLNYDVNINSINDEFLVLYDDGIEFYIYQPGSIPEIHIFSIVPILLFLAIVAKKPQHF